MKGEGMVSQIKGLVQDGSNSIANVLELLQSCTKPSISDHHDNQCSDHDYRKKLWLKCTHYSGLRFVIHML